jgi:hypothetical protein
MQDGQKPQLERIPGNVMLIQANAAAVVLLGL